jgi:dolichol-phosphate mannosyltransferase
MHGVPFTLMNSTQSRKTWIVLPAFNEEKDLPALLGRIAIVAAESALQCEILVVDDGSTDRTAAIVSEWAAEHKVRLQRHETNLGLGATLRDGVQWACDLAADGDVIITLDADNSHTPELIVRMLRHIREGHDVVIASRFRRESRVKGVPLNRRILSVLAAFLFRVVFPIRGVRDYTCGYRAYKAELLKDATQDPAFFDQDGFQVMVDILLKLRRSEDIIFGEVPLILRYDHKEGASKMNVGLTIKQSLVLIFQRRFT